MLAVFLWLLAATIFIIIEIVTLGLTSIWFAGGAIVASIAAAFDLGFITQLILFAVVAVLLLMSTRPLVAKRLMNRTIKTNVESLIGEQALVKEEIDNKKGTGVALLNGQEWTARALEENTVISVGTTVTVEKITGVRLIVK